MLDLGKTIAGLGACFGLLLQAAPAAAQDAGASTAARVVAWVVASGDNQRRPFIIVDKVGARVFVFAPDGRLTGASPVLLGLAVGDDSVPDIGDRELADIRPEERTTPAGRYDAAFGAALGAHDEVLWLDYDTAFSLHPVAGADLQQRLARLASPTPRDNRITFGCINVPAAFYEGVVRPTFAHGDGIVYVLPERRTLEETFPALPPSRPTQAQAPVAAVNAGA